MWKVYDFSLKKYEPFIFYVRDGRLTNISNRKYPKPHNGYQLWNADNTFSRIDNPNGGIVTISFPTWLSKTENVEASFLSQLPACFERYYYDDVYGAEGMNIFLIHKDWGDGYTEISLGLWKAFGSKRNRKIEKIFKRLDKLQVFS